MTIRDSFSRGMPPWLLRAIGNRLFYSIGTVLDGVNSLLREGVKARMPGVGTPGALASIGDDRLIDRGPTEPDENYAGRLTSAFDTWRVMGNPYKLLLNLAAFFSPSIQGLRLVSDRGVWYTLDPDTYDAANPSDDCITRRRGSDDAGTTNWNWDPIAAGAPPYRYWRGWVIIDAAGRWSQWHVGTDGVIVGDGHTVGSTATLEEVASIRRIVRRCKPAGAHVVSIIVTFVDGIFDASKTIATSPMPNGNYDRLDQRTTNAIYWAGVKTP